MAEQQENFKYNLTPLVPNLQPLDQQTQPPSSFGETLQQGQLPDRSGFGGDYHYELTALESVGNVASSLAAPLQSEEPQQSNFSPVTSDVVHRQTNDFAQESQKTVNINEANQQNIIYNENNLGNTEKEASSLLDNQIDSSNNVTESSNNRIELSTNQVLNQSVIENQYSGEPPTELNQDLPVNTNIQNQIQTDQSQAAQTPVNNQLTESTAKIPPVQENSGETVNNTAESQPSQENDDDEENTWSISAIKQSRLFPTDQTTSAELAPALLPPSPQSSSPTNELTKDNPESNSKKRRKRIVIDDSDDDETGEIREEVKKSTEDDPEPDQVPSPASSEKTVDSIEALEQRVEELKSRERPGPRSKKTSTILLREIEARTLLQNAVVIPTKNKSKKHKKHKKNLKRVLDSDEEEQVAPTIKMDVSDIGLFDGDPPQELTSESILVSENLNMGNDFFKLEGISIDEVGVVVPFENPILPEGEVQDDGEDNNDDGEDVIEILSEPEEDLKAKQPAPEPTIENSKDDEVNKQNVDDSEATKDLDTTQTTTEAINPETESNTPIIKSEPIESGTNISSETAPITIKQEKTDPPLVIKQEPCTQKEAENFLADALRSQFGCDDKSKIAKKSSEPIDPSSTFWGRDSSSSDESVDEWQPTSYVKTYSSSKKSWKKSSNASSKTKKKKRGHDSGSDDNKRRKKSSAYVRSVNAASFMRTQTVPAPNALGGRPIMPLVNQKPATIRVAVRSKEELKRKVKDRFFDRSRLVPNDIYFGDVQVPMHILHAYNSDAFDSSSDSDGYNRSNRANQSRQGYRQGSSSYQNRPGNVKQPMVIKAVPIQAYGGSSTNNALIDTFKRYLRAAGIKKVNFARLWEGCHTSAERARAMLKLLRNKGLQGEPTLAKCRALKKKRKVEKEVKELDTSVIIDDDEGIKTRRSTRQVGVKKEEEVPVVAVETLNKLKQVVDSESE